MYGDSQMTCTDSIFVAGFFLVLLFLQTVLALVWKDKLNKARKELEEIYNEM
jgi:hypothetical protein